MKIGRAIKLARVKMGWTQSQLAKKTSVSTTYISLLERDKRDPSLGLLVRISEVLNVPLPLMMLLAEEKSYGNLKAPVRSLIANELLALISGLEKTNEK